jgi:hypothetical protein
VLLVLLGGALVAFGGDEEEAVPTTAAPTTSTTVPATTTTVPRERAPLTGLPIDEIPQRPALVVKIDNAEGLARPQAGLNEADIVYEERVEGGVTRFAAVFHSVDAAAVGPVRSGRTTDIGIVGNLQRPLYAFSGANNVALGQLRRANLVDVGYDAATDAYQRRDDRRAPDNLFTSTQALWAFTPDEWTLPIPLFAFRQKGEALPAAATEVQGVDVGFTGAASVPVTYRWDAARGGWVRTQSGTPHVDEKGAPIAPHNLIIQYVNYVNTGQVDVAGTPVPEAELYGFGTGLLLTSGHAVEIQWGRDGEGDLTTYETLDGEPVKLTPGRTWIHLVPEGSTALVP